MNRLLVMDRKRSTRRLGASIAALVWLAAASAGPMPAASGQSDLPKGADVIDGWLAASGGAAYDAIRNRVSTSTVEVLGENIRGTVTMHEARPNLVYVVSVLAQTGKSEEGTDGRVAWEINAARGPRVKTDAEGAQALRNADFERFVKWRKTFQKAECVASAEVGKKQCFKVVMTPPQGEIEIWYIEKETKRLVKREYTHKRQRGDLTISEYYSDYRKLDGILLAYKARQIIRPKTAQPVRTQVLLITIDRIEHNVDLPKDCFDIPPAIQALLKESKQAP